MSLKIARSMLTALFSGFAVYASAQQVYSLQQALQSAKINNPVLKREQFNTGVSQSDIITAGLRPNPIINNQSLQLVQTSHAQEGTALVNGANRQTWWQLTKPFQMPVQRQSKIRFAEQNLVLTQNQYKETERGLFLGVAQKWLDAWAARKQLEILEDARQNLDSLVLINKLRLKNQVITTTDLSRTELLASQYAVQTKSAVQNYRNEIEGLKALLGTTDSVAIDTSDYFSTTFPEKLEDLIHTAADTRSDIVALKSGIDVATANISMQKAAVLPTPELGVIYNPQNRAPYMGIYGTLQIPVFSRNQGEIKKSLVLRQQAEQDLETTKWQLKKEISTAYGSYLTQKQNLQSFSQLLSKSQSIFNSVKYSYLRGGTTIIDLLEAQRSWLDTRQQYYETMQLYRQSYIDLLYASGYISQLAQ